MDHAFVRAEYCDTRRGFHKGVLTRFGDPEGDTKGITIPGTRRVAQRSAGCHPLLAEANLEAVDEVISIKMKDGVY